MRLLLGWAFFLVGCDPVGLLDVPKDDSLTADTDPSDEDPADTDRAEAADCDPATPVIDPPQVWFADADGDGQGDPHAWYEGCSAPGTRWTRDDRDCDDTHPGRFRDAQEVCDPQGIDEDCDGLADDADADVASYTQSTWYPDLDGDGYASPEATGTLRCAAAPGEVPGPGTDCDDANVELHPGAEEIVANGMDEDCDGLEACFCDQDQDGYGDTHTGLSLDLTCAGAPPALPTPGQPCDQLTPTPGDCDDDSPHNFPGGTEVCDGRDNDCDGVVDDADGGSADGLFFRDGDGDGYGDPGDVHFGCQAPAGYAPADRDQDGGVTAADLDCDDRDPTVFPGAAERVANGTDEDCDHAELCWLDSDDDGFGERAVGGGAAATRTSAPGDLRCSGAYVSDNTDDCEDSDPATHPQATERCDPADRDEDCDGLADDEDLSPVGTNAWYYDGDSDGFGSRTDRSFRCDAGGGWVANAGDCDDFAATANPDGVEVCNGVDDDCDGGTDDADDPNAGTAIAYGTPAQSGSRRWYPDTDGDGYGSNATHTMSCAAPELHVARLGDCDDSDPDIRPGAAEVFADGVDQDCDGMESCRVDGDGDGFGSSAVIEQALVPGAICAGHAAAADDCDDSRAEVSPLAPEYCDGLDNDCDRLIDDTDPDRIGDALFYLDADGDGEGSAQTLRVQCAAPIGFVANSRDCDDRSASINTFAAEICDPRDEDEDCDGYADDQDPGVLPETMNIFWPDQDLDGFGDGSTFVAACDIGDELSPAAGDCDDHNAAVRPGVQDAPADNLDANCDGVEMCYCNRDGDAYGEDTLIERSYDPLGPSQVCAPPASPPASVAATCTSPGAPVATQAGDCDDSNAGTGSAQTLWFYDADGDLEGSSSVFLLQCTSPGVGWTTMAADCDDSNPNINRAHGAQEVCDAANADEDCDGLVDDADPSVAAGTRSTWYNDQDGDRYGGSGSVQRCDPTPTQVAVSGDCSDNDPSVNPIAIEVTADNLDSDCDGRETCYCNKDGDSQGISSSFVTRTITTPPPATHVCTPPASPPASAAATCDLGSAAIVPGDCNDSDRNSVTGATARFLDDDGDGFGNPNVFVFGCEVPPGTWVDSPDDCNDGLNTVRPTATEVCDLIDNNCNGTIDEGVQPGVWWQDRDSDSSGNPDVSVTACAQPSGFVARGAADCNDNNSAIRPGAAEVCDFADNDCDGLEDEGVLPLEYWQDRDGDGSGNPNAGVTACSTPVGFVARGNADCNDDNAAIEPGAPEVCDFADNDCDGQEDEGVRPGTYWRDADGDTFGTPAITATACSTPAGFVAAGQPDCNDNSNSIRPGLSETCNGTDDNCNGGIDEAPYVAGQGTTFFADFDGDGFGLIGTTVTACVLPPGYALLGGDCIDAAAKDQNPLRHPGRPEYCDQIDNDCDASVDESAVDVVTLWQDNDGDGFGDPATATTDCPTSITGVEPGEVDCDDSTSETYPGAGELCDAADNNCNNRIDDGASCGPLAYGFDDPVTGNAYLLVDQPSDWYVAEDYCYARGYRLLWLDTAVEESDIAAYATSLSITSFWVGYRRDATSYRRVSGPSGSLSYTTPNAYEISRMPSSGSNGHAVYWSNTSGSWVGATPTSGTREFICEATP